MERGAACEKSHGPRACGCRSRRGRPHSGAAAYRRISVSCTRLGVRASRVGQASLPASWRGIPAPCSRFRGGARPWKRAAGMPPELAGKDACPTPPARVPPQVASTTPPVPAEGCRKLRCARGRPRPQRPPHARRPRGFSHGLSCSTVLRPGMGALRRRFRTSCKFARARRSARCSGVNAALRGAADSKPRSRSLSQNQSTYRKSSEAKRAW